MSEFILSQVERVLEQLTSDAAWNSSIDARVVAPEGFETPDGTIAGRKLPSKPTEAHSLLWMALAEAQAMGRIANALEDIARKL